MGAPTIFSIFAIFLITIPSAIQNPTTNMVDIEFANSLEHFGGELFSVLAKSNANKNIVFSPFSIQTCVAMARLGATGETALQMDKSLGLKSQDDDALAENYYSLLSLYENSKNFKIANKIYVMKGHEVQDKYNELLSKKFFSSADNIDFEQKAEAAKTINGWVESKTNNLIKDLVPASSLSAETRLILVNAIHFKGEWVHKFDIESNEEKDFYIDETNTVKVEMMIHSEQFRYGDFPELDATAVEMPYKDSDLSMLIILPNSRTGLVGLEEKLKTTSLHDLSKQMKTRQVRIEMPKFKAEFSVELSDALKELGMTRMFSDDAEFGKMLKSPESLKISKAIHKAFIEVNEEGTEAAAATGAVVRRKRALVDFTEITDFNVDHPFLYHITHKATLPPSSPLPNISSNARLALFTGKLHSVIGKFAVVDSATVDDDNPLSTAPTTPTLGCTNRIINDEL